MAEESKVRKIASYQILQKEQMIVALSDDGVLYSMSLDTLNWIPFPRLPEKE